MIDSNGYIRINVGTIAGTSKSPSDELLDSDKGTYVSENATVIYGGGTSSERQFGGPGEMPPDKPDGEPGEMPPDGPKGEPGEMPPERPDGEPGEMPPEKPDGEPVKAT